MYEPLAYTYMADYHCPDCARAAFGSDPERPWELPEDATDAEGNLVGAVFEWNEWWQCDDECEALSCSDCGTHLASAHRDDCEVYHGDSKCNLPLHLRWT